LFVLLGGFSVFVIMLAWYLYREHTREMRQAVRKVQFVGQVSHELKTPLTNIRLYAEMLEDKLEDDPQQQRYVQIIVNESQRLTRLVTNVLNFSRQPRVHKKNVDPNRVIQSAVEHFSAVFRQKGIAVNLDLGADGMLYTDSDLFEQILNNLLSNVEKYAANGKRVDISSRIDSNRLTVSVCDFGAGIPRNERKRIFQPFYRINDSITEGVTGTGIGLTIAHQQARSLGGDLQYLELVGHQGACFQLVLPMKGKR
jgi:signal transduction histidine kinase